MPKRNEPKPSKYRTVNLDPAKYAELEADATALTLEENAKVSVPALIYRMHKQFREQRDAEKAKAA